MLTPNELTSAGKLALDNRDVLSLHQNLLEVCQDLPAPVYPDKSAKQVGVDLVHPMLNAQVSYWLVDMMKWVAETSVQAIIGGKDGRKFDFTYELANGKFVALEVQLGNGGRLQTDFDKFKQLNKVDKLALGIAVYLTRETAKGADSGLAIYETARDYVLDHLDDVPLAIVGLERKGSAEADLSQIPGIVFPSLLGGSGENRDALQMFIAKQLLDGKAPADIKLEAEHRNIVEAHALKHVQKNIAALKADIARALAMSDASDLKPRLLAMYLELMQSSYIPQDEQDRVIRASISCRLDAEEAAQRADREAKERRREERANTPLEDPVLEAKRAAKRAESAQRELRQATKAATLATAYAERAQAAADKATRNITLASSSEAVATPVEAPAARPVLRVVRAAQSQEKATAEAAHKERWSKPAPRILPALNTAMGQAFAGAGVQRRAS